MVKIRENKRKTGKKLIKKSEKSNVFTLFTLFFSQIICFFITTINLTSFINNKTYLIGITIVQLLYFLPMLVISLYIFYCPKPNSTLLIYSTLCLILYSIILHFFVKQIVSFFTPISGIINFVEYAWKIYAICLPLLGIRILLIKKENRQKAYFLIVLRIILLFIIMLMFKNLFGLKGVLYSWSLSEFISILISFNGKHPSAK